MEVAAAANGQAHADDSSRIQEYPEFDKQFSIPSGVDLDVLTDAVLQKADEETALRQEESLPTPPPGLRVGSPAYHVFQGEAYQTLRLQVKRMQFELRDYNQQKRQQYEAAMKKEMMSETAAPQRLADSA